MTTTRGSAPIRVGLIGAGGIAGQHLPGYLERPDLVNLVAVCDVSEERAALLAAKAGVDLVYTDPGQMIRDAPIDAVDICAPPAQHYDLVMRAVTSGRHVLVEKPMGCSLRESREMVEAADRAGVTFMVAQNLRFTSSYQSAREAVIAGEIGSVRAVRIDLMMDFSRMFPPGDWRYDALRAGGGVVNNGAVHLLDLCRFLVGEVRTVSATCRTLRPDLFVNGAEDLVTASLEFENGAVGQLFASFSAPFPPWEWRIVVLGDTGTITNLPLDARLPLGPVSLASQADTADGNSRILDGTTVEDTRGWGFVEEVLHFAECCRTGAEPLSSGRDNLETMRQVFGIYESSRTGSVVELASL